MKVGSNGFMWYLRADTSSFLKQCIIKLYNLLKMNFHRVILMMYKDVLKAFKVETCTVYLYFFILYLISHTCGKSRMERTNKSKKKTNHIYSPPPIRLECISLVLLGLPCYHHKMEVILLNVNIYSNQYSRYHYVCKVFLWPSICLLSESFIRDL